MIKTTVVGSYPVPVWLRVMSTRENLRDAQLVVIKSQELAGIDVVADGELYRWDVNHPETNGMIDYFVRPLAGVSVDLSRTQLREYAARQGMAYRARPAGAVVGELSEGALDLASDYAPYAEMTPAPKKFTVTSPYMLAKVLHDEHYGDFRNLLMALAEILRNQIVEVEADVVQIDEANVTGHPEDGPLAAEAINHVLSGVRHEKGVHLCFGNYGGQTIQGGHYQALVEFLNLLETDHVVLEMARRPAEELAYLRDVRPEIALGIGVIDIKDNQVESASQVAQRLEHAANTLGTERIAYVHPDCGFWMLPRTVADAKMRALCAGRDLFEGPPA